MNRIQRLSQILSVFLYNSYFYGFYIRNIYQGSLKHFICPGLNCHSCPSAVFGCPVGAFQLFVEYGKYHIPFYVIGFLGIIGSVGGRIACGWACPFGLVQDLMYKIKSRKIEIPRVLEYGNYLTLAILVICVPYFTGDPWFCKLCPAGTLQAGIPLILLNQDLRDMAGWLFNIKVIILFMFIIWMIISKRPFCRTACPLGAIYSFFNKISMIRFDIDQEKCIKCNQCVKKCPMAIKVYTEGTLSRKCIRCFRCTDCPEGAVKIRWQIKTNESKI